MSAPEKLGPKARAALRGVVEQVMRAGGAKRIDTRQLDSAFTYALDQVEWAMLVDDMDAARGEQDAE